MKQLLVPFLVCAASVAAESVLAGGKPNEILRSLRQPRWALDPWAWYLVGLAYYTACFLALYRAGLRGSVLNGQVFWLLVTTMSLNASWNWLFFRRLDFRASFYFFFPYAAVVVWLVITLFKQDRLVAGVFAAYALYIPYATVWAFRVWRLNP